VHVPCRVHVLVDRRSELAMPWGFATFLRAGLPLGQGCLVLKWAQRLAHGERLGEGDIAHAMCDV